MWGEKKSLMLLFWSTLIVGGRVVRLGGLEIWKGDEVGKWEGGEVDNVKKVRGWQGYEDMSKREGGGVEVHKVER